jgi:MoaA/NifB/PqqE/SkfB family radical SAM enzyme
MKSLREHRKEIKIVIQALLMRRNIAEIDNLIDISKMVNASISFIHPIAFDDDEDKQHVHYLGKDYENIMQIICEKARKEGIRVLTRPPSPKKTLCTDPFLSPLISITGDIYPCCYIYEGRGGVSSFKEYYLGEYVDVPMWQYKMGNIFQDSFAEVWNGENFRLLREKVIKTQRPNLISYSELKTLRKVTNLKLRFNYCKICLFRWSCAC